MSAGRYFLEDVPYPEALRRLGDARRAAGCPDRLPSARMPLAEALGRVTAAPVWSLRSSPAFDAAAMDGIAVRSADTAAAGPTRPLALAPGAFTVVDTGDPLPEGADAIVMREHVHLDVDGATIRAAVPPYQHVRLLGEDVSATELLLPEGHRLRPADIAACAAAGHLEVAVRRAPAVAILPTGDEIVPLGFAPRDGQILDTNSLMLAAQVAEAGGRALPLPVAPDEPEAIASALRAACAEADVALVVAGSSAGRDDHTAAVVERLGTLAVHGVAVKPGHPVVLGVVDRTPVIGIPGYPVSAAMTFDLFAAPLLAELEGAAPAERPRARARVARKVASSMGMDDWIRVRIGRVGGGLVAAPLARGAGVLTSLVRADGLLRIPAELEGLHAGADVEVELLRGAGEIDRTIVACGSHDLVLDLAASRLRARDPGVTLASTNAGSLGGLVALRDGLCHLAGSHLLDPATGDYTLPYADRILEGRDHAVLRLVRREQGLIVADGNPLGLRGVEDLARDGLRYVNRQRGAGTRVLLDHELGRRGIDPAAVDGYAREEFTHLAVAAAVAAGRADAGLGVLAAARALGVGFVPLTSEPYDLVLTREALDDPLLAPLLDLMADAGFRADVEALGGYDASEMGDRIRG